MTQIAEPFNENQESAERAAGEVFSGFDSQYLNVYRENLELTAKARDSSINIRLLHSLIENYTRKSLELKEAYLEISAKNETMNQFLGIAAHDLRNPISINLMYAEFLLEHKAGSLDQDAREMIEVIRDRAGFMLKMLDSLLDLTRIEAGRIETVLETVDYAGLIKKICHSNRMLTESKNITLREFLPEKSCEVRIDPHRMEQVISNLITNAAKFSSPGTQIEVRVSIDEDRLVTTVSDQGQGIPAEKIPKLFRLFESVGIKPTAGEKSTGLGLAICKKVVEAHGGTIGVKSVVGKGSEFYFSLPLSLGLEPR